MTDRTYGESVQRLIDAALVVDARIDHYAELEAENRGLTEIRKTQDIFLDAAKGYIAQLEEVV